MERRGCVVTKSCSQFTEYQINSHEMICLCYYFQYLYGINQGGMDDRELEKILASAEQLRLREFEEVFPGSGQRAQGL